MKYGQEFDKTLGIFEEIKGIGESFQSDLRLTPDQLGCPAKWLDDRPEILAVAAESEGHHLTKRLPVDEVLNLVEWHDPNVVLDRDGPIQPETAKEYDVVTKRRVATTSGSLIARRF